MQVLQRKEQIVFGKCITSEASENKFTIKQQLFLPLPLCLGNNP